MANDEGCRFRVFARFHEFVVMDAEQANEVGAATLAPAQVSCVVDDACEVGVFEIDADGEDVLVALYAASQVWPVVIFITHIIFYTIGY